MILTAYLRKQVIRPFFLMFFSLTFIFGVYMLARYLAQAAEGEIPTTIILKLVSLRILIAQEILLPATFYFGILIGLNRLFRNAELIAMFACGFETKRLFIALFPLILLVAAMVATLSLRVRPLAWQKFYALKASFKKSFDLARLKGGIFYPLSKEGVFFAQKISAKDKKAFGVFIYLREDGILKVIKAREGTQQESDREIWLALRDGKQYEFQNQEGLVLVSEFELFTLPVAEKSPVVKEKLKAWSTSRLLKLRTPEALAELEWRFIAPIGACILAYLGLALSPTRPRQTSLKPFLWALCSFVFYFYGGATLKKLVAQGEFPPFPGVFLVPLLLLIAASIFFWLSWLRR